MREREYFFSFPPSAQKKAGLCTAGNQNSPQMMDGYTLPIFLLLNRSNKLHKYRETLANIPCMLLIKSIPQLPCLSPPLKSSEPGPPTPGKGAKGGSETYWKTGEMEIKAAGTHTVLRNWRGKDAPGEGEGCESPPAPERCSAKDVP